MLPVLKSATKPPAKKNSKKKKKPDKPVHPLLMDDSSSSESEEELTEQTVSNNSRIKVLWEEGVDGEPTWYSGCMKRFVLGKGHMIKYDYLSIGYEALPWQHKGTKWMVKSKLPVENRHLRCLADSNRAGDKFIAVSAIKTVHVEYSASPHKQQPEPKREHKGKKRPRAEEAKN